METKPNILVVDHNWATCATMAELLGDESYRVKSVKDGGDALAELLDNKYHLVLLELALTDINGIEVLSRIRQDYPGTDVIIMTSEASRETALDALRLGAQDYLLKPFMNLDIVLMAVNRAIEKRRLIYENARLHERILHKETMLARAVKRLTLLNEISNNIQSGHDLKFILRRLLYEVVQALEAERATLMLVDQERQALTIEAFVGIDETLAETVRVPIGEGIAGLVAKEGQTFFSADIGHDPRFTKKSDRSYKSDSFISTPLLLSVPILLKQEVIGVININNKKGGGSFTQEDIQLINTVAGQVAASIENARIFEKLHRAHCELKEIHFQTISALAHALEAKDKPSNCHSERLLHYAMALASRLGLSESEKELLCYAALLHDIGKIGIPEAILQKPDRLTREEYDLIKRHPQIGADLIREVKFLNKVAPIIRAHHEWYNGGGYPDGLFAEGIPIQARIVAVLDSFDAMTSERPYRQPMERERAIRELRDFSGRQFDPQVVSAFLDILSKEAAE